MKHDYSCTRPAGEVEIFCALHLPKKNIDISLWPVRHSLACPAWLQNALHFQVYPVLIPNCFFNSGKRPSSGLINLIAVFFHSGLLFWQTQISWCHKICFSAFRNMPAAVLKGFATFQLYVMICNRFTIAMHALIACIFRCDFDFRVMWSCDIMLYHYLKLKAWIQTFCVDFVLYWVQELTKPFRNHADSRAC